MTNCAMKVQRAFRRLIAIELSGSRESNACKYRDILEDIGHWLRLSPDKWSRLNIAGEAPPAWVSAVPDLLLLWERAHAAYAEMPSFADRRDLAPDGRPPTLA